MEIRESLRWRVSDNPLGFLHRHNRYFALPQACDPQAISQLICPRSRLVSLAADSTASAAATDTG
jgi:hypothetical protein